MKSFLLLFAAMIVFLVMANSARLNQSVRKGCALMALICGVPVVAVLVLKAVGMTLGAILGLIPLVLVVLLVVCVIKALKK